MKFKITFTTLLLLLAGGITAQGQTNGENSTNDSPPECIFPIPDLEASINDPNAIIDLRNHFSDPDEPNSSLTYEAAMFSETDIADLIIANEKLEIQYKTHGQASIILTASNNGLSVSDTFIIGVRPVISGAYSIAGFEEISLEPESAWNGSDLSGQFISGQATFINSYNADWMSWSGWACSDYTDNVTPGYMNQYSAFSPVRLDSVNGKNYGVSYAGYTSEIILSDSISRPVKGFFVTNATYSALSMLNGDPYAKKFGGDEGTDEDWFKLTVGGISSAGDTTKVDFMLADYRFEDNNMDYVISTWQWVDLTPLGDVYKLIFNLHSTDIGDFGMNTPAYFCMDNLFLSELSGTTIYSPDQVRVYPNPASEYIYIHSGSKSIEDIRIIDASGRICIARKFLEEGTPLETSSLRPGIYILNMKINGENFYERVLIQ